MTVEQIEEIEQMPAGLELDLLIAMHVFGRRREDMTYKLADGIEHISIGFRGPEDYSTDIAAAWRVVDKLSVFYDLSGSKANREYCMSFYLEAEAITACGNTEALAICRAALKVSAQLILKGD